MAEKEKSGKTKSKPILIVGIPRTGSSWLARTLSVNPDTKYIHEPDNEKLNAIAYILKENLHRYPYLRKDEKEDSYYRLWELAFAGNDLYGYVTGGQVSLYPEFIEGEIRKKCNSVYDHELFRRTQRESSKEEIFLNAKRSFLKSMTKLPILESGIRQVVVKSVHSLLALKWIDKNFDVDFLIIVRHPASVIASYLKLKLLDGARNIFSQRELVTDYFTDYMDEIYGANTVIDKMALQVGAFYSFIQRELDGDSGWLVVKHEDLCRDPFGEYERLYRAINLEWNENVEKYIDLHNRRGEGFATNRIASEQIDKYKKLLNSEQIDRIQKYCSVFGNEFYCDF